DWTRVGFIPMLPVLFRWALHHFMRRAVAPLTRRNSHCLSSCRLMRTAACERPITPITPAAGCASDRGQPTPARGVGESGCPKNAVYEGNFVRAMLVMQCRKFVSGTLGIGAFVQRKPARLPIR